MNLLVFLYFKEVPQKKKGAMAVVRQCALDFIFSRDSFHVIFSYKNFDVGTQMVHFLGEALSRFFSFEWNCLHVTKSALRTSKRRNALMRYINRTAFLRLSFFPNHFFFFIGGTTNTAVSGLFSNVSFISFCK